MKEAFIQSGLLVFVYMTIFYVIALLKKNNGLADIAWGPGFFLVAVFTYFQFSPHGNLNQLVTFLIGIWGLRLVVHIGKRSLGKPEDYRYQTMRKKWGKTAWIQSYLKVFLFQGILMLIISTSFIYVNVNGNQIIGYLPYVGLVIWLFGFLFESIGDWQLAQFVKTKKPGQIMTTGLWKYTRHPNYFGEVVQWWGIYVIALSISGAWWTMVSPLLITFLILFVSGVPMLEKKYEGNVAFEKYKKGTSVFIPWFPKGD